MKDKAYQLNDQEQTAAFEGKIVKVTGTADEDAMLIQLVRIEGIEEVDE